MISTFTDSSPAPRPNSRARISSVRQDSASLRSLLGLSHARATSSIRTNLVGSASTGDLFVQFWSPGLLDRLHEPLTRYRE